MFTTIHPDPTVNNGLATDASLEDASQALTAFITASPAAIVCVDLNENVSVWNPAAERLFGWSEEEMIGRPISVLVPEHQQEMYRNMCAAVIRDGAISGLEAQARRKDGGLIEISVSRAPLRGTNGEIRGAMDIVLDITGRKRAEAQIRLLATALESAANGVVITDRAGNITWVNPAFTTITGYSEAEVSGLNPRILASGKHDARFYESMWETILGGQVWQGEVINRRKDGRVYTESQTITPVRDDEGKITHFIAIKQDITEKKLAEQSLYESERRFSEIAEFNQAIIQASTLGIATYDGESGQCLSCNRAIAESIGGTADQILKQSFREIESWKISGFLKTAEEVLATGIPQQRDVQFLTSFGKNVLLDCILIPFAAKGRSNLLLMFNDITERKQIEQQLRQAQKMEAVGQLAGGIAHDFNNLLGVIIGYSDLLLERLDPIHPMHRDVEQIKQAGDRAARLTRQLLAFSRKQVLQPRVLDLNTVLTGTEKLLRRLIGEDVELRVVPGARLGRVKTDPGQLEQIIMNLAVNARDAMQDGGTLTIETMNIELDQSYAFRHPPLHPGPYVLLAITDTGCGMSAETQAHIFEPFFTTKGAGKGTGLGLSIVYGIVKQSGGYIWVYSEPEKGTTFKIYLPVVDELVEPGELHKEVKRTKAVTETILIAEDDAGVRMLTQRSLQEAGYTVLDAASPADAADISEHHQGPIHLMVTDVVMPKMSGRELANHLSSKRPEMKVLYVSGYADDAIVHHGVLDPGVAFLPKPFSPRALTRKVAEVLESAPSPDAKKMEDPINSVKKP